MPEQIQALLRKLKTGLVDLYGDQLKAVLSEYQNYGEEIDRTGELVSRLSLEYGLSISRVIIKEVQWQQGTTPLLRNIRAEGIPA